jgi:hypothetical protein
MEVRGAETPELTEPQARDNAVAGVSLKGFRVDFHEGSSLLTVE